MKPVLNWEFPLLTALHGTGGYCVCLGRGKASSISPSYKTFCCNRDLLTTDACAVVEQMLWKSPMGPFLFGSEACSIDRVSMTWRLDGLQAKGKASYYCSAERHGDRTNPVSHTKYLPAP